MFYKIVCIRSSISKLEAVRIFKLRGQKTSIYGHIDIMIYTAVFLRNKQSILLQHFLYGALILSYMLLIIHDSTVQKEAN